MKELIKSGDGQMLIIKKYNADMFHLIPDDYREFQIKEYIKDQ
jgi:hypothetical protein